MGVLLNIFGSRLDEVGGPDVMGYFNCDANEDDGGGEIADNHGGLLDLSAIPWWRLIFDSRFVFPNG